MAKFLVVIPFLLDLSEIFQITWKGSYLLWTHSETSKTQRSFKFKKISPTPSTFTQLTNTLTSEPSNKSVQMWFWRIHVATFGPLLSPATSMVTCPGSKYCIGWFRAWPKGADEPLPKGESLVEFFGKPLKFQTKKGHREFFLIPKSGFSPFGTL